MVSLQTYVTQKYKDSEKAWEGVGGAFGGKQQSHHDEECVWYMPLTEGNERQYMKRQNLQECIKNSPQLSGISDLMEKSKMEVIGTTPMFMHVNHDMDATLYKLDKTHLLIVNCYHVEYYLYRCVLCLLQSDGTAQIWIIAATRHYSKTELSKNYLTAEVRQEDKLSYHYCGEKISEMLKIHDIDITRHLRMGLYV